MPQIQGHVHASYQAMTEVFGEPEKLPASSKVRAQWKLAGGTLLHDDPEDSTKVKETTSWVLQGWSAGAVDQVIGVLARAGRFGSVEQAGKRAGAIVHVGPAPAADAPAEPAAETCLGCGNAPEPTAYFRRGPKVIGYRDQCGAEVRDGQLVKAAAVA
jgi:hypothetical protein